ATCLQEHQRRLAGDPARRHLAPAFCLNGATCSRVPPLGSFWLPGYSLTASPYPGLHSWASRRPALAQMGRADHRTSRPVPSLAGAPGTASRCAEPRRSTRRAVRTREVRRPRALAGRTASSTIIGDTVRLSLLAERARATWPRGRACDPKTSSRPC